MEFLRRMRPHGLLVTMVATVVLFSLSTIASSEPTASEPNTQSESQLARVMRDRTRIASILSRHHQLHQRLEEEFQNNHAGFAVIWDPMPPKSGRLAEIEFHSPELEDTPPPGTLHLRVKNVGTGWDQLSVMIFELHNRLGAEEFERVWNEAVAGELTAERFARLMLEQEFRALVLTRQFLLDHVKPLPGAHSPRNRRYWRLIHSAQTLDEHIDDMLKRGGDLTEHFIDLYNNEVVEAREFINNNSD